MTEWTLALFADRIGDGFAVDGAPEGTVWTLVEAEPLGRATSPASAGAFSLVFRGARDPVFAQQTVSLHHADLGQHAIFVVPIGRTDDGMLYQAVFS